jgi:hypothetical protein
MIIGARNGHCALFRCLSHPARGNRTLLQQLAETIAAFAFNNKEVPRLQRAMIGARIPARRMFSSCSPAGAGSARREALRRLTSSSSASIG